MAPHLSRERSTPLTAYVDAWVANDVERIVSTVTDDCTIVESYGPVYRGRERVRQWAAAWFATGGIVHRWEITDHFVVDDREAAQWVFEYTWYDERNVLEGSTIATAENGLIRDLREYQTRTSLYEWRGTWRREPVEGTAHGTN